jgi:tellurite resistance protein TerC
VAGLVVLDLFHNRGRRELSVASALRWSALWIGVSLAFGGLVWWARGGDAAAQYVTAWTLEKALSVDNLFVFMLIFAHFRVSPKDQHHALMWGIAGAIVMRAAMIFAGIELMRAWHPVVYVLGGVLALTGVRTLTTREDKRDIESRPTVRLLRRLLPHAPQLLLVVMIIEVTDLLFAIDSIPAVLAVTSDPLIVLTSNILAILGLRALFVALARLLERIRYLRVGLAVILILIGAKMCLSDVIDVPPIASLAVTLTGLAVAIIASLVMPGGTKRAQDAT